MTTDAFVAAPAYTISGTGPYAVPHEYDTVHELVCTVVVGTDMLTLVRGTEYTVSPSGLASAGAVTLSATAAATHAGRTLLIDRATIVEQGWQAQGGPQERGLEGQLDRLTRAVQDGVEGRSEIHALLLKTLRVPEIDYYLSPLPVIAERANRLLTFDAAGQAAAYTGAVSLSVSGTSRAFDTAIAVGLATVAADVTWVTTAGYLAAGDDGHASFKRVAAEPAHAGKLQTANGIWFEMTDKVVYGEAFGMVGDLDLADPSATDFRGPANAAAHAAAMTYAKAKGALIVLPNNYNCDHMQVWDGTACKGVARHNPPNQKAGVSVIYQRQAYTAKPICSYGQPDAESTNLWGGQVSDFVFWRADKAPGTIGFLCAFGVHFYHENIRTVNCDLGFDVNRCWDFTMSRMMAGNATYGARFGSRDADVGQTNTGTVIKMTLESWTEQGIYCAGPLNTHTNSNMTFIDLKVEGIPSPTCTEGAYFARSAHTNIIGGHVSVKPYSTGSRPSQNFSFINFAGKLDAVHIHGMKLRDNNLENPDGSPITIHSAVRFTGDDNFGINGVFDGVFNKLLFKHGIVCPGIPADPTGDRSPDELELSFRPLRNNLNIPLVGGDPSTTYVLLNESCHIRAFGRTEGKLILAPLPSGASPSTDVLELQSRTGDRKITFAAAETFTLIELDGVEVLRIGATGKITIAQLEAPWLNLPPYTAAALTPTLAAAIPNAIVRVTTGGAASNGFLAFERGGAWYDAMGNLIT